MLRGPGSPRVASSAAAGRYARGMAKREVGARCLSRAEGRWAPGTVRAVHEDGTYCIEFDDKSMTVLPRWYGVPPEQVAFDDRDRFGALLDAAGVAAPVGRAAFVELVRAAAPAVDG